MKKILLSLFISFLGLIGFSSFCSAGTYTFTGHFNYTVSSNGSYIFSNIPIIYGMSNNNENPLNINCVFSNNSVDYMPSYIYIYHNVGNTVSYYKISGTPDTVNGFNISFTRGMPYYIVLNNRLSSETVFSFDYSCVFSGYNVISVPICPTCPSQYTSEECQTEYDLIPSSDLITCNNNLQSCQTALSGWDNTLNNCSNNLLSCESSLSSCIQSNCPIDTGSVMWSSIWINGIQHLGKPVINIDIPDQIYRQYTTDDEEFNLYVGSGYDQEYIDSVIAINSYHPTSEDFTSVFVGGLTLIMPYIFVALLILFIRKLVKRIFK